MKTLETVKKQRKRALWNSMYGGKSPLNEQFVMKLVEQEKSKVEFGEEVMGYTGRRVYVTDIGGLK